MKLRRILRKAAYALALAGLTLSTQRSTFINAADNHQGCAMIPALKRS